MKKELSSNEHVFHEGNKIVKEQGGDSKTLLKYLRNSWKINGPIKKKFHDAYKNVVRQEFLYHVNESVNWPDIFGKQFGNL